MHPGVHRDVGRLERGLARFEGLHPGVHRDVGGLEGCYASVGRCALQGDIVLVQQSHRGVCVVPVHARLCRFRWVGQPSRDRAESDAVHRGRTALVAVVDGVVVHERNVRPTGPNVAGARDVDVCPCVSQVSHAIVLQTATVQDGVPDDDVV